MKRSASSCAGRRRPFASLIVSFAILNALFLAAVRLTLAAPPAPMPISPLDSDWAVVPTFAWTTSPGADHYRVQVGPQSDPNAEYWSASTYLAIVTPNLADAFPNAPLYWRVAACDAVENCAWSARVNFLKHIPAPALIAPHNQVAVAEPSFGWQPVQGAVRYTVEVTTDPSFNMVDFCYSTYNASLTPWDALPHGTYYWRVTPADAASHGGTPSAVWTFVKHIPAPASLAPLDGAAVTAPEMAWQAADGAADYQVELTTDATFNSGVQTFQTANTSLVPNVTLADGRYYWRVHGVDAGGHVSISSTARLFDKRIPAPIPLSPADGVTVTEPSLAWSFTAGAAVYEVELAINPGFVPISLTLTTYNLRAAPKDRLPLRDYYWRVRSVDADGHRGQPSAGRQFTLTAPPAATDSVPALHTPANTEVVGGDPTFRWSAVAGAKNYRLIVSANPAFGTIYDSAYTDYLSFTPREPPGQKGTYADNTYYWKVEARNAGGTVISTSEARSFTKQLSVPLSEPADDAIFTGDPTFRWQQVAGAKNYRLVISTNPAFSTLYDVAYTPHTAFTPYEPAGLKPAYSVGTYYWKVEARDDGGIVIAVSPARHFTKQLPLALTSPPDQATRLSDPAYAWRRAVGAHDFHVLVSDSPTFDTTYDSLYTDYAGFTPVHPPGMKNSYVNGTYYWKVDARSGDGSVIATSPASVFTKSVALPLFNPADGAVLTTTPTFSWTHIVGAQDYRLVVSQNPAFSAVYDTVYTDYPAYTPYDPPGQKAVYADGNYYWKVEARASNSSVIATSLVGTFIITSAGPTSTPTDPSPTTLPPTDPLITPSPATPGVTSTLLPPAVTPGPVIANFKTLGNVTVYASVFTDLGNGRRWSAEGHIRIGTTSAAYAEYITGTVVLDYDAMSIEGASASALCLLMDDLTALPVFNGPYTIDPQTGVLRQNGSVTFQIGRIGDLSVDAGYPLQGFAMNVVQGTLSAQARLFFYPIEGDYPAATIEFTLHHDGRAAGNLGVDSLSFEAAGLTFDVQSASFSYDAAAGGRITISSASIAVPEILSVGAQGSVQDLVISRTGLEHLGGGAISLTLPDLSVPGTDGKFKLAGASVTLSLAAGGKYQVHARVGFEMPNITSAGKKDDGSIGVYAEFELDQDGLRYVILGGTIDPGIPIGQTGFALTGLEGSVTLRPAVRVQVTGTIESELEVPVLGTAISGQSSVWVQFSEPYEIGISGALQVFIFDAANASLVLSQDRGLEGSLQINYLPLALSGEARLHVWRQGGQFHFTGSALVTLGFKKGALGSKWGIDLPPFDMTFGDIGAQFGEFCGNSACSTTVYGIKGSVGLNINIHIPFDGNIGKRLSYAVFIDSSGHLDYGSSLDQYRLVDEAVLRAEAEARGESLSGMRVVTFAVGQTDLAIAGLTWRSGSPTLRLLDPEGQPVATDVAYAGMGYTTTAVSIAYFIDNPKPGVWQAEIGNLAGGENVVFEANGNNLPPKLALTGIVSASASSYAIQWTALESDSSASLSLYYDDDNTGADGTLIAQNLNPAAGSHIWDASQVKTGDYYVYGRIDDHKNVPVVSYYTSTVRVANTQPPAPPAGLSAAFVVSQNNLVVCWNRNAAADVVGYRVFYGSQPGVYDRGARDAANATCASLPVDAWQTSYAVAITAYDNSGNESALSAVLRGAIDRRARSYLPMLNRP